MEQRNSKTLPLYVGKDFATTGVLCVDLKGNGLADPSANLEHPEQDMYSAGTFLNAVSYVPHYDINKHCDILNDMVDLPTYADAIAKYGYNPLQSIATIGLDLKTPDSKETLLRTIQLLHPIILIFQGFEAKEIFDDKWYNIRLRATCKSITMCPHPTDKEYATPRQHIGGGTSIEHIEEYVWSTLEEDLQKQRKRPLRDIDAKIRIAKEPSLVGKMLLEFAHLKPDNGYAVCRIDANQQREVTCVKRFGTKEAANAFHDNRTYNTIVIGNKPRETE